MNSNNKVSRIEKYRAMIAGVQANVAAAGTIAIRGTATTQPVIVSTLQGYADAVDGVATALAAYREAVAKQKAAAAAAHATYLGVKTYALAQYGDKPTTLGTFGLEVTVPKTPSAETKAAAAAKRKATLAGKEAGSTATAATPAPAAGGSSATTAPKA